MQMSNFGYHAWDNRKGGVSGMPGLNYPINPAVNPAMNVPFAPSMVSPAAYGPGPNVPIVAPVHYAPVPVPYCPPPVVRPYTSTGTILVLFILLVIILRAHHHFG
jgi:hypothetical protein